MDSTVTTATLWLQSSVDLVVGEKVEDVKLHVEEVEGVKLPLWEEEES